MRKPVLRFSDQVRHKLSYTITEDGQRLEIYYVGSTGRRIVPCSENKDADQLRGYWQIFAFVFAYVKKGFLMKQLI